VLSQVTVVVPHRGDHRRQPTRLQTAVFMAEAAHPGADHAMAVAIVSLSDLVLVLLMLVVIVFVLPKHLLHFVRAPRTAATPKSS
jgi:hypothetical protein